MRHLRLKLPVLIAAVIGVIFLSTVRRDDAFETNVTFVNVPVTQRPEEPIKAVPFSTTVSTKAAPYANESTVKTAGSVRSFTWNKDLVRMLVQSQGAIIPVETNRSGPARLRHVTNEDIKATLHLLDQKVDSNKNLLASVVAQGEEINWDNTKPKLLLIVTSWRSGSTFLGEILSNHPSVFHHYEPLAFFGAKQIRGGEEGQTAIDHLRSLFHCNYSNAEYIEIIKNKTVDMLSHNVQLWDVCEASPNPNTCKNASFLSQACHRFPTIVAKTVRLRLVLTRFLLQDPEFEHLKIVYLIRDPRATINSRLAVGDWCRQSEDCISPQQLCTDLINDLDAFEKLAITYPGRLALIKYETLASEPHDSFNQIFRFANLPLTASVNETIRKHTTRNEDHLWSTFRQSGERIDRWKLNLDKKVITGIQSACSEVFDRLGLEQVST